MAPALSQRQCLSLHEALLQHTLNQAAELASSGIACSLFLTSALSAPRSLSVPANVSLEIQKGHDLGQRMEEALSRKWKEGFRKVLFVGTDTPLLEQRDIAAAVEALDEHEVVIGPAADGGYYLIGFSALRLALLTGIDWGTAGVYRQTVDKLKKEAVSWWDLGENFDLDTYEDLLRFQQRISELSGLNPGSSLAKLSLVVEQLIGEAQP